MFTRIAIGLLVSLSAVACDRAASTAADACAAAEVVTFPAASEESAPATATTVATRVRFEGDRATFVARFEPCAIAGSVFVTASGDAGRLLAMLRNEAGQVISMAPLASGVAELPTTPEVRFVEVSMIGGGKFVGGLSVEVR